MVSVISRINFPLLLLLLLPLSLAGCAEWFQAAAVLLQQPMNNRSVRCSRIGITDQCMALARQAGVAETGMERWAGRPPHLLGGIAAGAWSLVRGAAVRIFWLARAGGATGAAKGAIDSTEQSPIFRRYVERRLRERGYDVIGWK